MTLGTWTGPPFAGVFFTQQDWDIYYWATPPERWEKSSLLEKLKVHAKNEGKVQKDAFFLNYSSAKCNFLALYYNHLRAFNLSSYLFNNSLSTHPPLGKLFSH